MNQHIHASEQIAFSTHSAVFFQENCVPTPTHPQPGQIFLPHLTSLTDLPQKI